MKRFYHRTNAAAAESILKAGFRDATGDYMMSIELTGVWVSEFPLGPGQGARGDTLVAIDGLAEESLTEFEIVEDEKPYREWCVPAALLSRGCITIVDEDDEPSMFDEDLS